MFGTIKLSDAVFGSHVKNLTAAKLSLSNVSKPTIDMSSESKVIDLYENQFNDLTQLVKSYVSLLESDILLIHETGAELSRTDSILGESLFSGLN